MDVQEVAEMHAQETNYWWHIGRRQVLGRVLGGFVSPHCNLQLLDLGCGAGVNFSWLRDWGQVDGLDNSPTALAFCRAHRAYRHVIEGDASNILTATTYDLVTAFDVLEHIQNDVVALQNWHRVIKPNGWLYLTVPAHAWLFTTHDQVLHHFRRYSALDLRQKVECAGFEIKFLSPFFFFTFPVFVAVRWLMRGQRRTTYETASSQSRLTGVLVALSQIEASWLGRGWGLPWGSSLVLIAKRIDAKY
ncbi:MAG: class I SAM-dependent methyltransferase [Patescibacteria group bacterium]|nr:class I SAM-dependent methyltransferase [Patescibacteria group bacterium]